jgi:hypothetical protein
MYVRDPNEMFIRPLWGSTLCGHQYCSILTTLSRKFLSGSHFCFLWGSPLWGSTLCGHQCCSILTTLSRKLLSGSHFFSFGAPVGAPVWGACWECPLEHPLGQPVDFLWGNPLGSPPLGQHPFWMAMLLNIDNPIEKIPLGQPFRFLWGSPLWGSTLRGHQ